MEMGTHHPSKRGSMEDEDRLSSLPDDLLHSILRELPLKYAARTSALSRRWAPQWLRALAASKVVDLTDPDFARGQPPARGAATVRRCLELHAEHGAPLDVFRAALRSPPPPAGGSSDGGAFGRDVVGWIASAVARGAREVEVDLTPTTPTPTDDSGYRLTEADAFVELPGDLFAARNSLARLALGGFSLRAVPAAPTGLAGLRSLSLSHADVTDEAVRDIVSSCRALEQLSLRSCDLLRSVRIAGATLRALEIVRCPAVRELRVEAPSLESFAFHGDTVDSRNYVGGLSSAVDLGSTPALRQAYLSHIGFDDDVNGLPGSQVRLLQLLDLRRSCPGSHALLRRLAGYNEGVEIDMPNIQELQLLLSSEAEDGGIASFTSIFYFIRLPLLDRLFVRLPSPTTDASDAAAALPGEVVDDSSMEMFDGYLDVHPDDDSIMVFHAFDFVLPSLSFIKLVNFRGTRFQLQLLAFLLKRTPALEQLVLVTVGEDENLLELVQSQVSAMRKASPQARLTVCRSSQDCSQNPVHTRLYHEE